MNRHEDVIYEFGDYRLDPNGRLSRGGKTVTIPAKKRKGQTRKKKGQALSGKPLEVLLVLAKSNGRVVTKRDFLFAVWGGGIMSEEVLTQHIMTVRKFLGDDPKDPEYIETVPGSGYRFMKPVTIITNAAGVVGKTKEDIEAEELHKSGLASLYQFITERDLRRAISSFKQACAKRPDYAPAMAACAEAHIWGGIFSWEEPVTALAEARSLADRARNLDPELGDAQAVFALADLLLRWNWEEARATFERVIRQNPTCQPALRGYALWLMANGRFDDALRKINDALELSPESFINIGMACMVLYAAGVDDPFTDPRIYAFMKHVTDDHSEFKVDTAWYILGLFYERVGHLDKAVDAIGKVELSDEQFLGHLVLAYIYAVAGDTVKVQELLNRLKTLKRWVSPFHFALIELALGNRDEAKRWLDDAIKRHDPWACLLIDPRLKGLRGDPEFLGMFPRVNLDPEILRRLELVEAGAGEED